MLKNIEPVALFFVDKNFFCMQKQFYFLTQQVTTGFRKRFNFVLENVISKIKMTVMVWKFVEHLFFLEKSTISGLL